MFKDVLSLALFLLGWLLLLLGSSSILYALYGTTIKGFNKAVIWIAALSGLSLLGIGLLIVL